LLTESDPDRDRQAIVITLGRGEVRQLYETVSFHLDRWDNYPDRPVEEKERLLALQTFLNIALLEFSFHGSNK